MKRIPLTIGFGLLVLMMLGCTRSTPPEPSKHQLPPGVEIIEEENGLITYRSLSFHYQDLFNPRLAKLKITEPIQDVIAPGSTEIEKMQLLRDWVSSQWEDSKPDPYPPWDAVTILRQIRSGRTGGFRAQYAVVLGQASIALGWQARYLATATKERPDNGHMTIELWSNEFNKWIVMDPYFCADFEMDGVPLGALEIHNALVKNKSKDIKINLGNDKRKKSPGKTIAPDEILA
jgi:hypothetical protein